MNRRRNLYFFFIFGLFAECQGLYGFVQWHEGKPEVSITDKEEDIPIFHIAKATYDNKINSTGWAFLELHTSKNSSDEKQAYAAGYLEGFLTKDLIWMHWQNILQGYCNNKTELCHSIQQFVDSNEKYVNDRIAQNTDDPYWYQLKLLYIQLDGLAAGYDAITSDPSEKLSKRDFLWLNMLGDLDDIATALSPSVDIEDLLFPEHCSGLVKLLPDLSNLYTSQVTWNSYQSMLRFQKKYVLYFKETPQSHRIIPGHSMSMSSYPGSLQSMDDFYIISSGLVAAETTIGNSNMDLFKFIKPTTVIEFARSLVANRLAVDGSAWVSLFGRENSGTYNNQWFIVDYKQFESSTDKRPGRVNSGLLWVIEQIPGYTEAADLTPLLKRQSYFPSYNIPYFPTVFNMSGGNEEVAKYGDWFGYDTTPRARIFKREQAHVTDLHSMTLTMRYNDFLHDPLSRCESCNPHQNAENAIAARNDLNPANGTYPFRALSHRSHGATDAKVTSASLYDKLQFIAVSSPTFNEDRGIPPFRWSTFDLGAQISHVGHPDEWSFSPLIHDWQWG